MTNQAEIIEAAARVFRTKGYQAATVQDIADEVGILKGSLYHHVASKEELLYLVVKEPMTHLYAAITEIATSPLPATEKLRRAIRTHVEAVDRHYPHLFVYLRESEDLRQRFRETTKLSPKLYERLWQQILQEGVKSGEFRGDIDIKIVSYGLLGMINWLHKWYSPQGRLGARAVAEEFAAFALAGITLRGKRRATATPRRRSS